MKFSNYVLCGNANPDVIGVSIWIPCNTLDEVQQAREKFHTKFNRKILQLLKRVSVKEVNTWTVYTILAYEPLDFAESAIWRSEVQDGHIAKALAQLDDIDCELVVYEHVREDV